MFKRLSKAHAVQDEASDVDEHVMLDTVMDEDSHSESESNSDDDDIQSDESDDGDSKEGSEGLTVVHAMESPIYMDDEVSKLQHFRCVSCPIVILKNDKSVDVHLESKNHKRRHARFVAFAKAEVEREGEHVLDVDPRTLVDLLEDQRAHEAREAEAGPTPKPKPAKRKHDASYVPRVERRKMRRAARRERRERERTA